MESPRPRLIQTPGRHWHRQGRERLGSLARSAKEGSASRALGCNLRLNLCKANTQGHAPLIMRWFRDSQILGSCSLFSPLGQPVIAETEKEAEGGRRYRRLTGSSLRHKRADTGVDPLKKVKGEIKQTQQI